MQQSDILSVWIPEYLNYLKTDVEDFYLNRFIYASDVVLLLLWHCLNQLNVKSLQASGSAIFPMDIENWTQYEQKLKLCYIICVQKSLNIVGSRQGMSSRHVFISFRIYTELETLHSSSAYSRDIFPNRCIDVWMQRSNAYLCDLTLSVCAVVVLFVCFVDVVCVFVFIFIYFICLRRFFLFCLPCHMLTAIL